MKRGNLNHRSIFFCVLLLCMALLMGCAGNTTVTAREQYDLGLRYLSESNYEEAILAFTKAIEIDEKHADAYVGRAQAYVALGTEEALAQAKADYATAASLYEEQGETEKAEQVRDEAQAIAGEENGENDAHDIVAQTESLSP